MDIMPSAPTRREINKGNKKCADGVEASAVDKPWPEKVSALRLSGEKPMSLLLLLGRTKVLLAGAHGLKEGAGFDGCRPTGLVSVLIKAQYIRTRLTSCPSGAA